MIVATCTEARNSSGIVVTCNACGAVSPLFPAGTGEEEGFEVHRAARWFDYHCEARSDSVHDNFFEPVAPR